ncbi:MAG TPA: helix-turn-helix transcriptional regulator [Pseudonocardiaceae bacterium]|nr:helix-turn-helix transcriptional regulator [Pseudonocardiaceae bacterium]
MTSAAAEDVATAVRMELARRRMTGKALAESIGMGQRSISKRLVGKVPFKADELLRIADVFGMKLGELLDDSRDNGEREEVAS